MRNDLSGYDYKSGKLFGTNGVEISNKSNKNKKYGRRQRPRDYGFQHIEPLPGFDDRDVAEEMLNTVANNPGILKVMEKHRWKVPVLKELYPDGKVGESEECIMGLNKNNEIFLINSLNPLKDVCAQGILLHEIIHVIQQENEFAAEYEDNTKKHLREMNALVSHNLFLSHHGKKILYSNYCCTYKPRYSY